jgi:L-2,4-diaminobutyrate decarboxylase
MTRLERAFSPDTFRAQGHALIDQLADYLQAALAGELEQAIPWSPPDHRWAHWQAQEHPDPTALFTGLLDQSVRNHHPRYMGHQLSPVAPVAALASLAGDLLNNGMGVYEMGMVGTPVERLLVSRLAGKWGWPDSAGGFLTSGGTLANLTALLAARSAKASDDVWQDGNRQPLALLVSEQAHYCVDRAMRIMGWGERGIIKVPVRADYMLDPDALEPALQQAQSEGLQVVAAVGSACSTATGSFDDLEALGRFCSRHGLWFHVDAAHGGMLAFSPKHRRRLRGIQQADSVVMDFHKMGMIPAPTTALVFRDERDSYRTFRQKAGYLWAQDGEEEWYNLAKRTFECTKNLMGIKVWAVWQTYGDALFEEYVDRVMSLAESLAEQIGIRPDLELAIPPQSNILCFRYRPEGVVVDRSRLNAHIRQALLEEGRYYVVQTQLQNETWLRTTLTNPFTQLTDLAGMLDEVRRMGTKLTGLKKKFHL